MDGDFVAIEHELGLRLVDFRVDIAGTKNVRLPSLFAWICLRELQNAFRLGGGGDDKLDRKIVRRRASAGGMTGNI